MSAGVVIRGALAGVACGVVAATLTGCAPVLVKSGVVRTQGERVLEFVAAHPDRAALYVTRGDTVLAAVNADRAMPLASTAKALIAVEYAYQGAEGALDPGARVPLAALERFHVPRTDGGAHERWLRDVRVERLVAADGTVPLREVVRGMIRFSSNANAEWLLGRVGVARVDARALALDVRQPMPVYHAFASAQLVLRDPADTAALRRIPDASWIARAAAIHDSLAADTTGRLRRSANATNLSLARQRVWSDRLPSSTARDYARLADRIASRAYFPPAVQRLLEEALDAGATAPAVAALGYKGGSTAWVLTGMTYIRRKDGTRTAYAVLFDGLSSGERVALERGLRVWNLLLDTDPVFRDRVAALGRRAQAPDDSTAVRAPVHSADDARERDAAAWALRAGERVRLDLWPAPGRGGWGLFRGPAQTLAGRYAGRAGDTLLVAVSPGAPAVRVPAGAVRAVYRGRGASRLRSASRRAAVGVALAALTTPLARLDADERRHTVAETFASKALWGGVGGVLAGALRPQERWQLVPRQSIDRLAAPDGRP